MVFKEVLAIVLLATICHARPCDFVFIDGEEYCLGLMGYVYDAWKNCNDYGMQWVNVETKKEAQALFDYIHLNHPDRDFWTGGGRAPSAADFYWSNGVKVTEEESFWAEGHPSPPGIHDLDIVMSGNETGFVAWPTGGMSLWTFCEWKDNTVIH